MDRNAATRRLKHLAPLPASACRGCIRNAAPHVRGALGTEGRGHGRNPGFARTSQSDAHGNLSSAVEKLQSTLPKMDFAPNPGSENREAEVLLTDSFERCYVPEVALLAGVAKWHTQQTQTLRPTAIQQLPRVTEIYRKYRSNPRLERIFRQ